MTDNDAFEEFSGDPEVAAAAVAMAAQVEQPEVDLPLDGPVTLPGGFTRVRVSEDSTEREEVRTAWVRELNGEDEERIAKAKLRDNPEAFINTILECGVERLGNSRPTKEDIDSLVMGDRDYLLMKIAQATYGDELEYQDFRCYHCGQTISFTVHVDEDIPVTRLSGLAETEFDVPLTKDRIARVRLPDVRVAGLVAEADTEAEMNTILIAQCVEEIRGKETLRIDGDADAARRLGMKDRQTLVDEMGKRMPGPRYNEVTFVHEDGKCDKEVRLTVTLADLFRGM